MSLASSGSLLIPLLKLWKSSGVGFLSSVTGQNYLCKVNLSLKNCERGRILIFFFCFGIAVMTTMGSYFSCTLCFFPQTWCLLQLCTCIKL